MAAMGRRFELHTARLTVRPLARPDVTAFVRYRNLPGVARYQDWELPYTRDSAHRLIDDMERLGRPSPGEWVQLAIEHTPSGRLAGDVAVWLDEHQRQAMIGYTLAPEFQGHGFTTEAVAAVIEWLFSDGKGPGVHRIAATLDPLNRASARVLEALGFEYEGTARSAAYVRGTWDDDARFALLRPDWEAWKARPTGPPERVELTEVSNDDVRHLLQLGPAFSQREMVASVAESIGDALVPPIEQGVALRPWYRAIRADGELVGFVMLAEPHEGQPHPYLWRLVIARRHQLRGIGRKVIELIADGWRTAGAERLFVSYIPDVPGNPARFYTRLGFVPTGRIDDGEVEAALDLAARASGVAEGDQG